MEVQHGLGLCLSKGLFSSGLVLELEIAFQKGIKKPCLHLGNCWAEQTPSTAQIRRELVKELDLDFQTG